ncbi:MAG: outer membrane protein, partial [Rhizomicrobium sp.]
MKIRMLALTGVAVLALSGTASAGQGWYLGLGAGLDHMGNFKTSFSGISPTTAGLQGKAHTDDSALLTLTAGYKFENDIRLETEIGYAPHNINGTLLGSQTNGHVNILSTMFNAAYDIPLSKKWAFSLGAGAGIGQVDIKEQNVTAGLIDMNGTRTGWMWQAMAGFTYTVNPNVDVYLDWRYRNVGVHGAYASSYSSYYVRPGDLNEQAVMVGVRYFFGH